MNPEGPESKLMLSKLKSQLEELRSKVAFLDCVKKYLEVLVDSNIFFIFFVFPNLCSIVFILYLHKISVTY